MIVLLRGCDQPGGLGRRPVRRDGPRRQEPGCREHGQRGKDTDERDETGVQPNVDGPVVRLGPHAHQTPEKPHFFGRPVASNHQIE